MIKKTLFSTDFFQQEERYPQSLGYRHQCLASVKREWVSLEAMLNTRF